MGGSSHVVRSLVIVADTSHGHDDSEQHPHKTTATNMATQTSLRAKLSTITKYKEKNTLGVALSVMGI